VQDGLKMRSEELGNEEILQWWVGECGEIVSRSIGLLSETPFDLKSARNTGSPPTFLKYNPASPDSNISLASNL
jgi:hypothetical protein